MNLNKVFIIGRVTANPEIRTTPGGQSVSSFSIATNRTWMAKTGGKQDETEFHNIVAWGRTAEVASQFLQKGGLVMVEGRLRTRSWQDKQSVNHKTTEIICERLQLGPRAGGGASPMGGSDMGGASGGSGGSAGGFGAGKVGGEAGKSDDMGGPTPEELPIIDLEDEIKPEEIPF
jgi:single-strand DNA-binding protein